MRAHGWTRDLKNRREMEALFPEIDPDFLFVIMAFNLRPTEINAALGLIQLKIRPLQIKDEMKSLRCGTAVFCRFSRRESFYPMEPIGRAGLACFGYPVICREPRSPDEGCD